MFNKLKQIKDLRSQAKQMQDALAQETITVEEHGVKIIMNGNMEVLEITVNSVNSPSFEKDLKNCFNEAIKKTQKLMAQKMYQMGGLQGLM